MYENTDELVKYSFALIVTPLFNRVLYVVALVRIWVDIKPVREGDAVV